MTSVHEESVSQEDIVLNPEVFTRARAGDLFELSHAEKRGHRVILKYNATPNVKGTRSLLTVLPSNLMLGNASISVSKAVASLLDLGSKTQVIFEGVSAEQAASYTLDFVEVTFKDQFISRSDMG